MTGKPEHTGTVNLVVDIGNTLTKIAWFDQEELIEYRRLERTDPSLVKSTITSRAADRAIVSSVGKTNNGRIREWIGDASTLIILDHHTPLPLQVGYKTPETLGRDRIAACSGAHHLYPGHPLLIIDSGTAITIDFVTVHGEYRGGNISPGLQTRFRALHQFTAKLPLVEADPAFPSFGTDTRTAITAGVQEGMIFELNGYLDEYAGRYNNCKFIITGGDAAFLIPRLRKNVLHIPELVLTGLNCILEFNASRGNI